MIFPLLGKPTVRVHLTGNEPSVEGVLIHKGARELRLTACRVWESAEGSHTVDGLVVIPRERVTFWQVVS